MSALTRIGVSAAEIPKPREPRPSLARLMEWVEQRDYAGWEPYDFPNSPVLSWKIFARFPLNWLVIQAGKQLGSVALRTALRIPSSKNPKALALFASGYCDLARSGHDTQMQVEYLRAELSRLRSPDERDYCWGYDWPYVSLRGSTMQRFSPNAVATVTCGEALLDMWQVFGDTKALEMAKSVGIFIVTRLNRTVDRPNQLCFSYTPSNFTQIYNSSALCSAFLARLGAMTGSTEYTSLAQRGIRYLADAQRQDGSWPYGAGRSQGWVDSFHTGFNLSALSAYESASQDRSFSPVLKVGFDYYIRSFFGADGEAKYYPNSVYPIDIHSCSQALLTLTDFAARNQEASHMALKVLHWTEANMQSPEGFFFYQYHRWWLNRVPYMRWAQAWMFRALAHLQCTSPS